MESKRNQVNKAMIKGNPVVESIIKAGMKHLRRICEEAKLSNIADRLLASSIFNPHLLLEAIKKGDDAIKFLKPGHTARLLKYCEDFLERKKTFDDAYKKAHSEGDEEKKSLLLENLPRNYRDFIDALREEQEEFSPENFSTENFSPERFFSLCKECNTKMGTKTMEEYCVGMKSFKKILTSEKKERSKEEAFQEYLFDKLFEKFEKAFCETDLTLVVETLLDYVKMREKKVYGNSCIVGFLRNVGIMKKRLGQSDEGYTEMVFKDLRTYIPNLNAELTVLEKAGLLEWKSEDDKKSEEDKEDETKFLKEKGAKPNHIVPFKPSQYPLAVFFTDKNGNKRVIEAKGYDCIDEKEGIIVWETDYEKERTVKVSNKSIFKIVPIANFIDDGKAKIPANFLCPITGDIMQHPHFTMAGHTYEYEAINNWINIQGKRTDPMTGARLKNTALIPNHNLRSQIQDWIQKHPEIAGEYRNTDAKNPNEDEKEEKEAIGGFFVGQKIIYPRRGSEYLVLTPKKIIRIDEEKKLLYVKGRQTGINFEDALVP